MYDFDVAEAGGGNHRYAVWGGLFVLLLFGAALFFILGRSSPATLTIATAPGASVRVDGEAARVVKEAPSTVHRFEVTAGPHRIEYQPAGGALRTQQFEVDATQRLLVFAVDGDSLVLLSER